MPKIALSDAGLRSVKPPEKGTIDFWDAHFPAFGVRVSQGGTKTFVLNIGKTRRALGRFGILSLAEARTEARRILAERTLGKVRPQSVSFQTALEEFLADKEKTRRKRTVDNLRDRLRIHLPFKGLLSEVTHSEVMRQLAKTDTNAEHDHALSVAKTFFTWAHNRRYIDDNPTRGISKRGSKSRSRVLTDAELKSIWQATEEPTTFNRLLRFCLLTGQRRGEASALRREWICEDVITFPATITKNGRQHQIPIPSLALSAIGQEGTKRDGLIFPAKSKISSTPFTGWSKSKLAFDRRCPIDPPFVIHDLRRTLCTKWAEDLRIAPHLIERYVNHVSGQVSGVAAIYNRATYMDELRECVARWQAHVTEILT
jgi:integrase